MILKVGDLRLSPRPRYIVYDEEVLVHLRSDNGNDSNCTSGEDCASAIEKLEFVFKVRCLGRGDISASKVAYQDIVDAFSEVCGSNPAEYFKQVKNETPDIYQIVKAYVRPIDIDLEYTCEAPKTGEVHLTTADLDEGTEIAVIVYTAP